jgi:broad specificity phosphatase PhoE
MTLYLVRHAQAGSRQNWDGEDDTQRPLTSFGRNQAADMVGTLADVPLDAIFSSPYLRCIETAAPLGARRSIVVEVVDALAEGPADRAIALLEQNKNRDALFCSHGDIIPALLEYLVATYHVDLGQRPRCQKSSIWIVDLDAANPADRAIYVPPSHRSQ